MVGPLCHVVDDLSHADALTAPRPLPRRRHHGAACLAGPIPRSRCAGGAQRPGTACRAAREKDRSVGHASRLAAALVAVAVSFSSLWPAPLPALALGRLTAEETRTVEMFKRSRPSVVFITTLRKAKDSFTQDVMDVPLGEGTGEEQRSRGAGHVPCHAM